MLTMLLLVLRMDFYKKFDILVASYLLQKHSHHAKNNMHI